MNKNRKLFWKELSNVKGGKVQIYSIDDEQVGFRVGRGFIDKIFTLKQIGEKAQEKK